MGTSETADSVARSLPKPLEGTRPAFTPWAHLGLLTARTTSQGAVRHPQPGGVWLAAQPQTMHASCSLQRSLFRGVFSELPPAAKNSSCVTASPEIQRASCLKALRSVCVCVCVRPRGWSGMQRDVCVCWGGGWSSLQREKGVCVCVPPADTHRRGNDQEGRRNEVGELMTNSIASCFISVQRKDGREVAHGGTQRRLSGWSPPAPRPALLPTQPSTVSCPARAHTNTHVHTLSTHTYTCTHTAMPLAPRTKGGRLAGAEAGRRAGGREARRSPADHHPKQ